MAGQAANNGPGQDAGQKFVKFSRQSAQRIAKVVRQVEQGDRVEDGIHSNADIYRVPAKLATFTGTWQTGTFKTVTLTGTTNTVSVMNWTTPVVATPDDQSCERHVVFTKAAGSNVAVEIEMHGSCFTCAHTMDGIDWTTLTGYAAEKTQILGHGSYGCLTWYDVFTCTTAS
jgi:hypothetical protein